MIHSIARWLTVGLFSTSALVLVIGGIRLAALGGSRYYALAGMALLTTSVLLALQRPIAIFVYGTFFVVTVVWSFGEVGLDFWGLVPRLVVPLLLGLVFLSCVPHLRWRKNSHRIRQLTTVLITAVLLVLLAMVGMAFLPWNVISNTELDGKIARTSVIQIATEAADTEWRAYGHTARGTRFSPASEIDKENVGELEVIWRYRFADAEPGDQQATPIQAYGALYLCTDSNVVFSLDAETGRELWRFDAHTPKRRWQRCRGVGFYERDRRSSEHDPACSHRVITLTTDARLIALDALTGQPCESFGNGGFVDLKAGMGDPRPGLYYATSAPAIVRDKVIIGGSVEDFTGIADTPSGVIRAFSAVTGDLVWAWDLGNPKISGAPADGRSYSRSTPNMWSTPSFDDDLGLIYVPLGAPTGANDFWGASRSREAEIHGNSIVALDAETGRPRWHFQAVHHDIWDYDLPAQPTLVDLLERDGEKIPALIQGSKHGQIYMLDRRDGKPISAVEERVVPKGGQHGDWVSATQPYSVDFPSIGTTRLSEERMWGITWYDQLWCRIKFKTARYEGEFTPPNSDRQSIQYPGLYGGMNWGGLSVDESRGYLIANDIRIPVLIQLLPRLETSGGTNGSTDHELYLRGRESSRGSPLLSSIEPFMSPLQIPCNSPPWGTLTAIDLGSRRIAWQVPMGTARDVGPLGLTWGPPFPLGLPTLGGTLVTKSGLVFFSGTQDHFLRAIDIQSGRVLWRSRLPVGSQATPITYVSPKSRRQLVVVFAGGTRWSNKEGVYVVAYGLPRRSK